MSQVTLTITNERGLHARAAAKFVKLTAQFQSDIRVTKGEQTVSGESIMGLMMLAAGPGQEIVLEADGPDEFMAIEALSGLVTNKFDESV